VSSWVAGTRELPGFDGEVEVALRVLRPADAAQLAKLDASCLTNVNQTLGALDNVFYTAAREASHSESTHLAKPPISGLRWRSHRRR
jgi:hypothetical protein